MSPTKVGNTCSINAPDHKVRCRLDSILLNGTFNVRNIWMHDQLVGVLLHLFPSFIPLLLVYRGLAGNTPDAEGKQHFLLEGLSQIQLAVSQQEHVVLDVQALLPSKSVVGPVKMDGRTPNKAFISFLSVDIRQALQPCAFQL